MIMNLIQKIIKLNSDEEFISRLDKITNRLIAYIPGTNVHMDRTIRTNKEGIKSSLHSIFLPSGKIVCFLDFFDDNHKGIESILESPLSINHMAMVYETQLNRTPIMIDLSKETPIVKIINEDIKIKPNVNMIKDPKDKDQKILKMQIHLANQVYFNKLKELVDDMDENDLKFTRNFLKHIKELFENAPNVIAVCNETNFHIDYGYEVKSNFDVYVIDLKSEELELTSPAFSIELRTDGQPNYDLSNFVEEYSRMDFDHRLFVPFDEGIAEILDNVEDHLKKFLKQIDNDYRRSTGWKVFETKANFNSIALAC